MLCLPAFSSDRVQTFTIRPESHSIGLFLVELSGYQPLMVMSMSAFQVAHNKGKKWYSKDAVFRTWITQGKVISLWDSSFNYLGTFSGIFTLLLIWILSRTLTKHQRALLEAYADDIEGRPSKSQTNPSTEETKNPLPTDNGEVYFTHERPSLGAWLSQRWQKIRDRLWS